MNDIRGNAGKKNTEMSESMALVSRLEAAAMSAVYAALRCPVARCGCFLYPPIALCSSGHSLCVDCASDEGTPCRACGSPLLAVRNAALEDAARGALQPCVHSAHGCDAVLPPADALRHARTCELRVRICPGYGSRCKWRGRHLDLPVHVRTAHDAHVTRGPATELRLDASEPVDFALLLCFGERFLARVGYNAKDALMVGAIQRLSARCPDANYLCEATLVAGGSGSSVGKLGRSQRTKVIGPECDLETASAQRSGFWMRVGPKLLSARGSITLRIRIEMDPPSRAM